MRITSPCLAHGAVPKTRFPKRCDCVTFHGTPCFLPLGQPQRGPLIRAREPGRLGKGLVCAILWSFHAWPYQGQMPATASLVWIQSTSLKHSNTSICHEVSLRISKGGGFCLPEKPCLHRFQTPHSPDFLPLSPQLLPFPKIDLPKALPSALCSLCDSLHIYILTFHFCTVNAPLHLGALISSDLGVSCPVRVSPYLPQSVFPEVNTLPFSSRPFFSSLPYNTPLFSHSLKLDF